MKRRDLKGDSMELFLDTICNTFGGILLIALLVIILLQISGKASVESIKKDYVNEKEYKQAEDELTQLREEMDRLQNHMKIMEAQNELISDPEKKILQNKSINEQKNVKDLLIEKESLVSENLETHKKVNDAQKDLAEKNLKLEAAQRELTNKKRRYNESVSEKSVEQKLPQFRRSRKLEVVVIVRFGRLYFWHRYVDGIRLGLNTDDMLVVDENEEYRRTMPNILRGTDLKNSNAENQIREQLTQFSPLRYRISAIVWPDSYEEYKVLRNAIVKIGFDYTPLPTYEGVVWIDQGGTERDVQ